jgi:hypothetical protein
MEYLTSEEQAAAIAGLCQFNTLARLVGQSERRSGTAQRARGREAATTQGLRTRSAIDPPQDRNNR